MKKMKGRIVEIEKQQNRAPSVTGGESSGTSLNVKIYIYDLSKSYTFDVYKEIKNIKGIQRISAALLQKIKSHEGKKVDMYMNRDHIYFDLRVLLS